MRGGSSGASSWMGRARRRTPWPARSAGGAHVISPIGGSWPRCVAFFRHSRPLLLLGPQPCAFTSVRATPSPAGVALARRPAPPGTAVRARERVDRLNMSTTAFWEPRPPSRTSWASCPPTMAYALAPGVAFVWLIGRGGAFDLRSGSPGVISEETPEGATWSAAGTPSRGTAAKFDDSSRQRPLQRLASDRQLRCCSCALVPRPWLACRAGGGCCG